MAARYVHNYGAFGRQVLNSPRALALLKAKADEVAEEFRAAAPVGEPYEDDDHRGRFRDSVSVHAELEGGPHHDRANVRIRVDDPAGLSIEFGHRVYRDARGRFTHKPGKGRGEPEAIAGSHTLTNALNAAKE